MERLIRPRNLDFNPQEPLAKLKWEFGEGDGSSLQPEKCSHKNQYSAKTTTHAGMPADNVPLVTVLSIPAGIESFSGYG